MIVFWLGSLGFLILSRRSIIHPLSHGFPRFFAFEAILGLVVLNAPAWFDQPFSLQQIVSWTLFFASIFLAVYSIWILRKSGKPDPAIQDANRLMFEKTTCLVTEGPYHIIRHPMYSSLLLIAWGIYFKHISISSSLLVVLACLALYTTAILEEKENLQHFGEAYRQYMRVTKRFIPFVF